MKKVIGLVAKKRSGKDYFYNYISKKYRSLNIYRIGFADAIKQEYMESHTGLTLEMIESDKETYRKDLQDLGSFKRIDNPNYWVDIAKQKIINYPENSYIFITDMRFQNEVDEVAKLCSDNDISFKTVKIKREGLESTDTHETEMSMDGIITDLELLNDGTNNYDIECSKIFYYNLY